MPKVYVLNRERAGNTQPALPPLRVSAAARHLINFSLLYLIVAGYRGMPLNKTSNSLLDSNQALIFFEASKDAHSLR